MIYKHFIPEYLSEPHDLGHDGVSQRRHISSSLEVDCTEPFSALSLGQSSDRLFGLTNKCTENILSMD